MNNKLLDKVMESGTWLKTELLKLDCTEVLADNICFATGQRQAMLDADEDLMVPVRSALERYKRGEWDTPGRLFAQQLYYAKFGNPPNTALVWKWIVEKKL